MKKVFTLLKNLWKSARNYSDANLQTAKDYTDTKTTVRPWNINFTTSGVNDVTVCNGVASGNLIINSLTMPIRTWTKVGTTTDIPTQSYVLTSVFKGSDVSYVGAIAIRDNGDVEVYAIQSLSSNAIYGLIAYTVGGVILNLLSLLSPKGVTA